jgi:hypothetical protein
LRAEASHPAGAVADALAARARGRDQEHRMNYLPCLELLNGQVVDRRERRAMLRRLGRAGRMAAYRRGGFDFDTCCLWAARWPGEVPLLHGEYEFIALSMPEVCE